MAVPQDHRAPGVDEIDVVIAVGIIEIGALGALDKERIAAHAFKRPYRGIYPTGDVGLRPLKEGLALIYGTGLRHI